MQVVKSTGILESGGEVEETKVRFLFSLTEDV